MIELLVVIAIIALLMGLLLPSLVKARDASKLAACIGKLRPIGMGLQMYVNELDNYPLAAYGSGQGATVTWAESIYRYMAGYQPPANDSAVDLDATFTCPAAPNPKRPYRLSYSCNSLSERLPTFGGPFAEGSNLTSRVRDTDVASPSSTMAIVDARQSSHSYLAGNTHQIRNASTLIPLSTDPQQGMSPHRERNNWLFCDGHVETRYPIDTIGPKGTPNAPQGMWSRNVDD